MAYIMMNRYCLMLITFVMIFFSSCKKHEANNKLGQLPFSDAYSIIVADSPDAPDFARLYKLTESDRLQELRCIAQDGSDMGSHYVPEGIYDLNRDFFMLSLSVNNSAPKVYETYMVRIADGNAFEISPEFHPLKSGQDGWVADYNVKAIKKGNDMIFYSLTSNQLQRIVITGKDRFDFKTIDISGIAFNNYDIDYQGHAMIGNTFIVSPDTVLNTSVYEQGNSYIAKAYDYGFYVIKLKESSIQIFHLYYKDQVLKTDSLTTLLQDSLDWQFKGSLSFPDYSQTFVVFDKGIVSLNKSTAKVISLDLLSINSIEMVDQSRTYFYLVGANFAGKKIFLKVNPAYNPLTYSDLIVPNLFDIKKLHVSGNNTVTIMAVRISDQKEVFRYIQEVKIKDVENYQAIKTRQVFTVH